MAPLSSRRISLAGTIIQASVTDSLSAECRLQYRAWLLGATPLNLESSTYAAQLSTIEASWCSVADHLSQRQIWPRSYLSSRLIVRSASVRGSRPSCGAHFCILGARRLRGNRLGPTLGLRQNSSPTLPVSGTRAVDQKRDPAQIIPRISCSDQMDSPLAWYLARGSSCLF